MSLRHALLGLLAEAPRSGYDLVRALDTTLAPIWPATQSQVYTELSRLADLGLVEPDPAGARRRRTYRLSPAGSAELRRWLLEADLEGVRRNDVLLRAHFLPHVDDVDARRLLGRVKQSADARGRLLHRLLASAPGTGSDLALEAARRLAATESEWAAWAADQIGRAPTQPGAPGGPGSPAPEDLGHHRAMGSEPVLDLSAIRDRIDDVDRSLVRLLAERSRLVEEVMRYKRAQHMRVVDRGREDEMLDRIGRTAALEGLDPRIARQVLRSIIDGFTLLEVEELGPDS